MQEEVNYKNLKLVVNGWGSQNLNLNLWFSISSFCIFFLSNPDERWGRKNHGQGGVTVVVINVIKKNVTFKTFEVSHEYQLIIYKCLWR